MAQSRWDEVDSWTGSLSVSAQDKFTDLDGVLHSTTMGVTSIVALERVAGADFVWSGSEQAFGTISSADSKFFPFGFILGNAGGGGSEVSEFELAFGLGVAGTPVEYRLPSIAFDIPVRFHLRNEQDNVPPFDKAGERTERVGRPSLFGLELPVRSTILTGSAAASIGSFPNGTIRWRLRPSGRCRPRRITLWINAFLPNTVSNILRIVPGGPYKGHTAVIGPSATFNDLFLTDERTFDTSINASSRMQSLIEIDLENELVVRERHRCSPTIEVDDDGDVECGPRSSSTSRMNFERMAVSGPVEARRFRVDFAGAANNACWAGSPDIDYKGRLDLVYRPSAGEVRVTFDVLTEPFPAFEMYARVGTGPVIPLFREQPGLDKTASDIFGAPTQPQRGSQTLTCF